VYFSCDEQIYSRKRRDRFPPSLPPTRGPIPQLCNFGYDVIVFVGESLFLRCRNYQEIRIEPEQAGFSVFQSQWSDLG
jgi:hypothetical protein